MCHVSRDGFVHADSAPQHFKSGSDARGGVMTGGAVRLDGKYCATLFKAQRSSSPLRCKAGMRR